MIIDIDTNLKPLENYHYHRKQKDISDRTILPKNKGKYDYKTNSYFGVKEKTISMSFDKNVSLSHINYSEYLCQAYAEHKSIVLTPDIIWHTVLSEIAGVVVEAPKSYAFLFTTDLDNKTSIVVQTDSVENIPMDSIILGLKSLIPTDVSMFFPKFTTTSELAMLAQQAAFAEMCTPYYSYSTMLCGYPRIDVQGELKDYQNIVDNLYNLIIYFEKAPDPLQNYLLKVVRLIQAIVTASNSKSAKFFENILTTKKCGSGGEIELDGWWVENMFVKNFSGEKPENLPSVISRVPYKNLETGRNFSLNCGLFYSIEKDGFSVPEWAWVKNEIFEEESMVSSETEKTGTGIIFPKVRIDTVKVEAREFFIDDKTKIKLL